VGARLRRFAIVGLLVVVACAPTTAEDSGEADLAARVDALTSRLETLEQANAQLEAEVAYLTGNDYTLAEAVRRIGSGRVAYDQNLDSRLRHVEDRQRQECREESKYSVGDAFC
jgi:septal ring factor EnvC (AmiA/AmiB activator)